MTQAEPVNPLGAATPTLRWKFTVKLILTSLKLQEIFIPSEVVTLNLWKD